MTNALILISPDEAKFTSFLKPMLSAVTNTFVVTQEITYLSQLSAYCLKRGVTKVITTSPHFLWKLLEKDWPAGLRSRPSIKHYAGSVYDLPGSNGVEILFINPLKQLVTMPAAKFITDRHISKITRPGKWNDPTEFSFTICNNVEKLNEALEVLSDAFAIAIDIETIRQDASISCVGYTGGFVDSAGNIKTRSFVIPFTSGFNLQYVRRVNILPIAKIFQNGKYDNAYFLRFNAPVVNWVWDTAHLFHSWYSELPKDLGFLNSFFLRKVQYWKDLAKSGDKYLYYKYNALDTWATFNVWMIQMAQMPAWARKNYTLEFPLVFPCLLSEMTGVRRDSLALSLAHKKETEQLNRLQGSLNRILGVAYFNTNSGKHMAALFKVLGLEKLAVKYTPDGDKDSYDEKIINRARLAHPFGGRILDLVLEIRGIRKNISTYLTTGEEAKEFFKFRSSAITGSGDTLLEDDGRILYALNPHGTDTGRLSSNEHQFWCGLNFQTAPRSGSYKTTIGADKGFLFAEVDLKQAESRDTANISGDKNLISALDSDNDFHAFNAAAFFGAPDPVPFWYILL